MPDYSLYGITDTAYGFLSRGCPRGCDFCIVAKKEGRASRKVADLREWWNGQKNIQLMDPNIIACPDWRDLLGQLADSGARVDINQGVDIRMMTDEKMEAINAVRLKAIHFAWDRDEDLEPIFRRWSTRIKVHPSRRMVYCLINYNTTTEFDLHRVYTLRDLGYEPYVMVYDKEHAPREKKCIARWCNNKAVFRSCRTFEEYNRR